MRRFLECVDGPLKGKHLPWDGREQDVLVEYSREIARTSRGPRSVAAFRTGRVRYLVERRIAPLDHPNPYCLRQERA